MEDVYVPINVRSLAKKVIPKGAKFIPFFVYNWLEKILHVKELDNTFSKAYNMSAADCLEEIEKTLDNRIIFDGPGESVLKENAGKNLMFVGNHPYGGTEAMALMNYLIHLYPNIKLVAQSFLSFVKPLRSCCVFNKKDVRTLMEHIDNKDPLLIYPSGKCSRILSSKDVFDNHWFHSFVKIAKKNKMDIVVIYTDGQLSKRFFRWQKIEGKSSLATLLLVDEMFKMNSKPLRMVVSNPISSSVFTDDLSNDEWALRLRQYCFSLRKDPFATFDPTLENCLPEN